MPFLDFPPDVRKVIYTTNAIESLNSSLRKLLHYRGHFPTDEAVFKLLYLALANIEKQWERSLRDWSYAYLSWSNQSAQPSNWSYRQKSWTQNTALTSDGRH